MTEPKNKKHWIYNGLTWGMFMFLTISVILPLLEGKEITTKRILVDFAVWIVMGLAYGYTMKRFMIGKSDS